MSNFKPIAPKYDSKLFATIGEELYLSRDLADVYFVFESNNEPRERVPAHKLLLKKGCAAFREMLNGPWKEKNEVKIVDTPVAAFKEFLQFFYKGDVVLTAQNVAAVMNLGKQYVVDECVAMCVKFLKNTLDESNASAVFKSNEFLSCDRNILAAILRLDWLSCSEVELFEACMAWVKAISKREILSKKAVTDHFGNLLYEIRFGSMTFDEFVALVSSYGTAFSVKEYQDVIQMIGDEEFQATIFNGKREKRHHAYPRYKMLSCSRLVGDSRLLSSSFTLEPYFLREQETTKFSANQPLFLRSIILDSVYRFHDGKYIKMTEVVPTEVKIIEVSHSNEEVELYYGEINVQSSDIYLSMPILIRPGFHYEIRLKMDPPALACNGLLLKSEMHIEGRATIQFHDDPIKNNNLR
ncbi:uncharacterized protein LOC116339981, partial [Contarinia nasturtii]|uniref:uncharacterized protein LOC116339981 n=1 Tax=Contarinia nasturtii TaxID=265458 RepID=UPI0012D3A7B1